MHLQREHSASDPFYPTLEALGHARLHADRQSLSQGSCADPRSPFLSSPAAPGGEMRPHAPPVRPLALTEHLSAVLGPLHQASKRLSAELPRR